LGDSYYYRVIIGDWRKRAIWYSPDPALGSTKSGDGYMYAQVPFETLKYNTPYYWLVEVMDTNNRWSAHNRSRSSWRQIYTGTKSGSADFLNGIGFRSSRGFRDGIRAQFFAVVHNLAPWDIDTTNSPNEFQVVGPTAPFYYFNPDNDAFTTDPVPFMYLANKDGAPGNGTYTFKVYENGTSNHEDASITPPFTIDNSVLQVTRDDMRHEICITRIDNAYLPYADPELFWKSKGSGYYYRAIVFDWNYRRLVWQSDWLTGVAAGNDMSAQVPQGTLKGNSPYRWWVEVYDSARQNRIRSQWLSFMTGPAENPGRFLPAVYLLLLLGD
jgi:hypothetical protein